MTLKKIHTRFQAYQLGTPGSSFSYFHGNHFTLIEARFNEINKESVLSEMKICGKGKIDTLHITSWDEDHCSFNELQAILELLMPKKIEVPGYFPQTENSIKCRDMIEYYLKIMSDAGEKIEIKAITPDYIKSLDSALNYGYNDVFYWPKLINDDHSNNNSTVKLFRGGCFNVLNTGDLEDKITGNSFLGKILNNELDILILPHHGSKNGFLSKNFLECTRPTLAICSSDHGNQYEHPDQEIRDLLFEYDINLLTTKTGDIICQSFEPHNGEVEVFNLIKDSTKISSKYTFTSKKKKILSMNLDTIRNRMQGRPFNGP